MDQMLLACLLAASISVMILLVIIAVLSLELVHRVRWEQRLKHQDYLTSEEIARFKRYVRGYREAR